MPARRTTPISGEYLCGHARVSDCGMVLDSPDRPCTHSVRYQCCVWQGSGDVHLTNTALIISVRRSATIPWTSDGWKGRSVIVTHPGTSWRPGADAAKDKDFWGRAEQMSNFSSRSSASCLQTDYHPDPVFVGLGLPGQQTETVR